MREERGERGREQEREREGEGKRVGGRGEKEEGALAPKHYSQQKRTLSITHEYTYWNLVCRTLYTRVYVLQ